MRYWAEIVPPRVLEDGIGAAQGMFGALAGERAAFELVLTADGPRWRVAATSEAQFERALAQVRAAWPQAGIEQGLTRDEGAGAGVSASLELVARLDAGLPLRTDWQHRPDPLAGVIAAGGPIAQERVSVRLTIAPAPTRAAEGLRRRLEPARESIRSSAPASPMPIVLAIAAAAAGVQAWQWVERADWRALGTALTGALVSLPVVAAAQRWLRGAPGLPERTVAAKLAAPLLIARMDVTALGCADGARAAALVGQVADAFPAFDEASGGGLRPRRPRWWHWPRLPLLLNAAEAAALWHLPEERAGIARARRTTARRLLPPPGHAGEGVRVGTSASATLVAVPEPLLHRNQLIVAKTRRGKSTLLRHLAAGILESIAEGAERATLVVVDPHQDLAEAVLEAVPDALVDSTVYLDFAALEHPVGLNLLDVTLFPDRDRTTENVITMLNRLWPANWGPRMEGALRATLAALLELNRTRPREAQFTLLDVAPFLTDERLREDLLAQVHDLAVHAWFRDNYERVGRVLQQQTANPVTSKIGRFTVTQASRLVLGQARSSFDPRALLREGGVLVINTAVGALGEGAASLVGATLLNLLGLLVEEQVALPPEERRRVIVLVDESSTLGAVDYTRMLSELGKYGASFVLVTQSLSKLDAVDRNLAPAIFANSDGLTVFQVSADDARRLLPELGGELEIEDLVSLDDFTCYARWWDGRTRPATFSFRVDAPPPSGNDRARAIAARSAARYGRPRALVVAEVTRALRERGAPKERQQEATGDWNDGVQLELGGEAVTQPSARSEPVSAELVARRRARGNAQRQPRKSKASG